MKVGNRTDEAVQVPDSANLANERTQPSNCQSPPWNLVGEGIILVYKFTRQWVEENAFLDPSQTGQFKGGLGYVMLVNYQQSPVGPYKELLTIPGKFRPHGRQSITRIFVDSQDSTDNGRYNWGIPKSTQPMTWRTRGKLDAITVGDEKDPIFYSEIERVGIRFPITTKLLPIRLYQQLSGHEFLVNPTGSGWASFARVKELKIQADQFPDVSRIRHLACFKVDPFRMCFP